MVDKNLVRSAIESASRGSAASAASCFADVPSGMLNKALELYAVEAAREEVFALVPSEKSGKSGFLLTDKALYFRPVLGSGGTRVSYDEILEVKKTDSLLRIASAAAAIEWELTPGKELLWERSRKNSAEFVATVLATALRGPESLSASSAPGESKESSPGTRPTVTVEHSDPVDHERAFAFHLPILLIGAPVLMPAIYRWLAESDLLEYELAELLTAMPYGRMVLLCAIALAPTMYAFGMNLKFSTSKFIVASLVIVFFSLQALARAATRGQVGVVIPLGGGALAVVVALALGYGGLAIRGLFARSESRSQAVLSSNVEAQGAAPSDARADCPSCGKTIPLSSRTCPHCSADFGPGSAYRLTRRRE